MELFWGVRFPDFFAVWIILGLMLLAGAWPDSDYERRKRIREAGFFLAGWGLRLLKLWLLVGLLVIGYVLYSPSALVQLGLVVGLLMVGYLLIRFRKIS